MGMGSNSAKLRAIVGAFSIPVTTVAKGCGVSRPYVARILSQKDAFEGSPVFWSGVERALGRLIEARQAQVFDVPARPTEAIEGLATGGH